MPLPYPPICRPLSVECGWTSRQCRVIPVRCLAVADVAFVDVRVMAAGARPLGPLLNSDPRGMHRMTARAGDFGMVVGSRQRMRIHDRAVFVGKRSHVGSGGRHLVERMAAPARCRIDRSGRKRRFRGTLGRSLLMGRSERSRIDVTLDAGNARMLGRGASAVIERRVLVRMAQSAIARFRPGNINLHGNRLVLACRSIRAVVRLRCAPRHSKGQHCQHRDRARRRTSRRKRCSAYITSHNPSFPR